MDPITEKIVLTIVGIAVSGLATWLGSQIVKYKKLIRQEEDATIKQTIESTLEKSLKPIETNVNSLTSDMTTIKNTVDSLKTDMDNVKQDIKVLQNSEVNFSTRLTPMQDEIEHLKDDITEILDNIKEQGVDIHNIKEREKTLEHETRCAWRYRIRQLCHAYLARGWMSNEEYGQLQEMYSLYTAIGGNGQTKELYERTVRIEIKPDAEAARILAEERRFTCPRNCDPE